MRPKIAVIDYGMGNLQSVSKALEFAGADVVITDDKTIIRKTQALVLPGVGSFGPAIKCLKANGLDKAIIGEVNSGKMCLGLCLGFQLLFTESEEEGKYSGLNIIKGKVKKFNFSAIASKKRTLKIPHTGWNSVSVKQGEKDIFKNIPSGSYFYFVHSYYAEPMNNWLIAATSNYGSNFCAAVKKDNLWACQFHPEKSGNIGISLLKNFVNEIYKTKSRVEDAK